METAKGILDNAKNNLINTYGDGIKTVLDTVWDIAPLFTNGVPGDIMAKLTKGIKLNDGQTIDGLIKAIKDSINATGQAQQKYVSVAQNLADASAKAIESKNLESLKNMLPPLQEQLEELDAQIKDIQSQLQLSTLTRPEPGPDGKVTDDISESEVTPPTVPEGYTQIVITADASALDKSTSSEADSSVSTSGANFFFCGYHSEKSNSSSSFSSFTSQKDTSIQIGMNYGRRFPVFQWSEQFEQFFVIFRRSRKVNR